MKNIFVKICTTQCSVSIYVASKTTTTAVKNTKSYKNNKKYLRKLGKCYLQSVFQEIDITGNNKIHNHNNNNCSNNNINNNNNEHNKNNINNGKMMTLVTPQQNGHRYRGRSG